MHETLSNDAKVLCAQMLVATTTQKSVPTNYFEEILRLTKSKFDAALKELVEAGYVVDTQEIEGGRAEWQVSCTPRVYVRGGRAQSSITNINTTSVIDSGFNLEAFMEVKDSKRDSVLTEKTHLRSFSPSEHPHPKVPLPPKPHVPGAMREAPSKEICKAWFETYPNKPQWSGCRGKRKERLNALWVELFLAGEYATVEEGVDWWAGFIEWTKESKFLRENSFFTLDWMIWKGNFDKIREQNYHRTA